jgi:hypothetical protein
MKLGKWFSERLPSRRDVLGVYAVIVFVVYSWTLVTSFYKLPSWMFYLTVGQILAQYAYAFCISFLDSILALAGILLLDLTIFLAFRNMEEFQSRSILMVLGLLISSMTRLILFPDYEQMEKFLSGELTWWAIAISLTLAVAIGVSKIRRARDAFKGIVDRIGIFLYIYLPLTFISLVVVLIRNLY